MNDKYQVIEFQVHITEKATLAEMAERVGKALNCHFAKGWANHFREGEEVLVAETLGLLLEISTGLRPHEPKKKTPTYFLIGWTHERLMAEWPIDISTESITPFVLQVLRTLDSPKWFDPSQE